MNIFGFNKKSSNLEMIDSFECLEDKISFYLEWCKKNNVEHSVKDIKGIIDKVTIWYELRYPNKYLDKEDIDKVIWGVFWFKHTGIC